MNTTLLIVIIVMSALALPAFIWSLIAAARVRTVHAKWSKRDAECGMTGADAAKEVLRSHGIYDVEIIQVGGHLTDHYDPKSNTIALSASTYNGRSISSIGVAAHEAGHAVQYSEGYSMIKLRTAIVPVVNFASKWSAPLVMIAVLLLYLLSFNMLSQIILTAAIILYCVYVIFTLMTLPVEFNASARAKQTLSEAGILTEAEQKGCRKVLSAAAQTYLSNAVYVIAKLFQLLLLLLVIRGGRRK